MKRSILIFGILSLGLLAVFRYSSYSVRLGTLGLDVILGGIALLFFVLGFLMRIKTSRPAPQGPLPWKKEHLQDLGLTPREEEVFQEICRGLSNREIAEKLFVSEHTVKTHVSNLLLKLNVKRRTQAMQRARQMGLL